ncbi:MAG: D-2-hydroxyacid dehydrogenase [Saprospiraceae bacterium]
MIKILVNDGIHPDGKMLLEEAEYQVDTDKIAQEDLPKFLPAYDAIIVRSATKVRKDLIDACPNLKVIARGGVGLDNIDVAYAESKGIKVINTPAASSRAVAELVFGHAFSLARMLHQSNRAMPLSGITDFKTLKSSYSKGFQLGGKTLGIIGFGRIGQEAAKIGIGLGMHIIASDPYLSEANLSLQPAGFGDIKLDIRVQTKPLDEVLKKADFLTVHVPFSGGKAFIGAEEIAKMKTGAILINTSRGGVVDEMALIDALNSGKLAGAGLDVFENEPTPRIELLHHEKISLTPHTGAETKEAQVNIGMELADKIIEFFGTN